IVELKDQMLSCTGKRSHRHTILHVSFSNSFGLTSAQPTPQGLSGAPKYFFSFVIPPFHLLTVIALVISGLRVVELRVEYGWNYMKFHP
ncbi:MAG: hypothetical protein MR819_10020, partial [Prevotella sp.]|nr:hypothetical protein [Prevotella sp.]